MGPTFTMALRHQIRRAFPWGILLSTLLLVSCASTPDLARLQATKPPAEAARELGSLASYLDDDEIKDVAHFWAVLSHAENTLLRLDEAHANAAHKLGGALRKLWRQPPNLGGQPGPEQIREKALRTLANAPSDWALRDLLELHHQQPTDERITSELARHLGERRQAWPLDQQLAQQARLALAAQRDFLLRNAPAVLAKAESRGLSLQGLTADAATVPEPYVDFYAAAFAVRASQQKALNEVEVASGFLAYHARQGALSEAVRSYFYDQFARHAPESYVQMLADQIEPGDPETQLRLLIAASAGKAAQASWADGAFMQVSAALPQSYRVRDDAGLLLQLAALTAAYSQEGRDQVARLAGDNRLGPNQRAAALIALGATGDGQVDPNALSRVLTRELDRLDPGLQAALLAYTATRVSAAEAGNLARVLARYYRSVQDSDQLPLEPFLEAYNRALTLQSNGLSSGAASIIRDAMRRDAGITLDRVRAYFSGQSPKALYAALFSGISSTLAGAAPDEKRAVLELLVGLFGPAFGQLDEAAQGRLVALYVRTLNEADDREAVLRLAEAGLELAHQSPDMRQRVRQALNRKLETGDLADSSAATQDSSRDRQVVEWVQRPFPYEGAFFQPARITPSLAGRARELLGAPPVKPAPELAQSEFGQVVELVFLPAAGGRFPINEPTGLRIEWALVFDQFERMRHARLPVSDHPDLPLDWSALRLQATTGTPRLDGRGMLHIDQPDPVSAAEDGLEVSFSLEGRPLGGRLTLVPDFSLSKPITLSINGKPGQEGTPGRPGKDGAQGETGSSGADSTIYAGRGYNGGSAGNGSDGGDGYDGQPGGRGQDAGTLHLAARALESRQRGQRLFLVELPASGHRFVLPEDALMEIYARGGAGGKGGDGGRGGHGGQGGTGGAGGSGGVGQPGVDGRQGAYCASQGCNCDGGNGTDGGPGGPGGNGGPGGKGGNGAQGGNGARGGNGGNGGTVCLVFYGDTTARRILESRLKIDVGGGAAGEGGAAGLAGAAGKAGFGGRAGRGGRGGMAGSGGMSGSGHYQVFDENSGSYVRFPLFCSYGRSGRMGYSGNPGNGGREGQAGSPGRPGVAGPAGMRGQDGRIWFISLPSEQLSTWPPTAEAVARHCQTMEARN